MTPFIDVLLVLLITFMLLSVRTHLTMQLADESGLTGPSRTIVLELTADGGYRLNTQPVSGAALGGVLAEAFALRREKVLFLKAAPNRTYQETITAGDVARGAGVEVIALAP